MKRILWVVVAVVVGLGLYYGLSMIEGAKHIRVGQIYTKDVTKERVVVLVVGPGDSLAQFYDGSMGDILKSAGSRPCVIFGPEHGSGTVTAKVGWSFLNEYGLVKRP
jgi:hypothetical protein